MNEWPFGHLQMMKYGAIVADPPWSYEMRSEKGYKKAPEGQYQTMSDREIFNLPIAHLASKDCYLFLWAVWPKLDIAMQALKTWGFTFKTGGAWHKKTVHGKTTFGTGYIVRSACEPFLIGTIGRPQAGSKSVRNLIEAPTRGHSRKPEAMRTLVEKLTPKAYRCELFAREAWEGNEVWGNEVDKFDSSPNPTLPGTGGHRDE